MYVYSIRLTKGWIEDWAFVRGRNKRRSSGSVNQSLLWMMSTTALDCRGYSSVIAGPSLECFALCRLRSFKNACPMDDKRWAGKYHVCNEGQAAVLPSKSLLVIFLGEMRIYWGRFVDSDCLVLGLLLNQWLIGGWHTWGNIRTPPAPPVRLTMTFRFG